MAGTSGPARMQAQRHARNVLQVGREGNGEIGPFRQSNGRFTP